MSLLGEEQWLFVPPVPRDLESLGISLGLVTDLFLRQLSVDGTTTLQALSDVLKIPTPVLLPIFTSLRQQQFIEVKGMVGNDYRCMFFISPFNPYWNPAFIFANWWNIFAFGYFAAGMFYQISFCFKYGRSIHHQKSSDHQRCHCYWRNS